MVESPLWKMSVNQPTIPNTRENVENTCWNHQPNNQQQATTRAATQRVAGKFTFNFLARCGRIRLPTTQWFPSLGITTSCQMLRENKNKQKMHFSSRENMKKWCTFHEVWITLDQGTHGKSGCNFCHWLRPVHFKESLCWREGDVPSGRVRGSNSGPCRIWASCML